MFKFRIHPFPPSCSIALVVVGFAFAGCGGGSGDASEGSGAEGSGSAQGNGGSQQSDTSSGDNDGGGSSDPGPGADRSRWPEGNEYSWDGSWMPSASAFPLDGVLDDEYGESEQLPPGEWDWKDEADDFANWRNFESNIGTFEPLRDDADHLYGWRLDGNEMNVDYTGPATYFEGSSGSDRLDLGPGGSMNSFGNGNLGDGPDELVFDESHTIDFRTGSSKRGSQRDNDLVVAGCGEKSDGSFDIETTTLHTGPGHDWVFVRDFARSAIDLGNGAGGRTDTIDPADGDDLAVIRGNAHDFRVFGGGGDDIVVWYVNEPIQDPMWLAANFFGGGGIENALWDNGTDRLVLVVPDDTEIVTESPTPDGALQVVGASSDFRGDEPTAHDPFAYYCVTCGTGPNGRKTFVFEYKSADGSIHTGHSYATSFEELQLGIGDGARVYQIDDVEGSLSRDEEAEPYTPPQLPAEYCE